jgi:hypothetical protein
MIFFDEDLDAEEKRYFFASLHAEPFLCICDCAGEQKNGQEEAPARSKKAARTTKREAKRYNS